MRINKEQKEGVARVLDGLTVAAIIAAVVGITGHSVLSNTEIWFLAAASPILMGVSLFLRRTK